MSVLIQVVLLGVAVAAALSVRPWRIVDWHARGPSLAAPLLVSLMVLPWLWSWTSGADLPVGLRFSGAPIAMLVLGWPLAILVLAVSGLGTLVTADATLVQALELTILSGVLPATAMLILGHLVRLAFGQHPVAYLMGRAFAVPLVVLALCGLLANGLGQPASALLVGKDMQAVATLLLALGEASWTAALAAMLVALRPQWLATWSGARYLHGRRVARTPPA
jgi:uncharacterized membrane protein